MKKSANLFVVPWKSATREFSTFTWQAGGGASQSIQKMASLEFVIPRAALKSVPH